MKTLVGVVFFLGSVIVILKPPGGLVPLASSATNCKAKYYVHPRRDGRSLVRVVRVGDEFSLERGPSMAYKVRVALHNAHVCSSSEARQTRGQVEVQSLVLVEHIYSSGGQGCFVELVKFCENCT